MALLDHEDFTVLRALSLNLVGGTHPWARLACSMSRSTDRAVVCRAAGTSNEQSPSQPSLMRQPKKLKRRCDMNTPGFTAGASLHRTPTLSFRGIACEGFPRNKLADGVEMAQLSDRYWDLCPPGCRLTAETVWIPEPCPPGMLFCGHYEWSGRIICNCPGPPPPPIH